MRALVLLCPSTGAHEGAVTSWIDTATKPWEVMVDDTIVGPGAGYLQKLDALSKQTEAEILGYMHSDLYILEKNWDGRVRAQFEDEEIVVVSFFGARRLGDDDLYKVP